MFHYNKFATKKRSTATTYKEMAETTFCRRSQQEQKFAKHDPEPQFTNKMLSRPTRCRRNVVYFDREMFWKFEKEKIQKKVVWKDNLQNSYQKRPFAKNDKNKQIQNKKYQED